MSDDMLIWFEIGFNVLYLVVVWGLVIAMLRKRSAVSSENRKAADITLVAFALLALGDSGHVGFRILAYSIGSLESKVAFLGEQWSLVAIGTIMTAITVTIFYVLMLELWRIRFNQRYGWFEYLLLGAVGVRFLLMLLPQNDWNQIVPVQPWVTLRNLPFFFAGFGIAYLMIRDARKVQDRNFVWIGYCILISFACYIPVILFVQQVPMLGMLMIPKTVAYVVIGFLAYNALYTRIDADLPVPEESMV